MGPLAGGRRADRRGWGAPHRPDGPTAHRARGADPGGVGGPHCRGRGASPRHPVREYVPLPAPGPPEPSKHARDSGPDDQPERREARDVNGNQMDPEHREGPEMKGQEMIVDEMELVRGLGDVEPLSDETFEQARTVLQLSL